jgi:Tfp pilus assembly protein PilZ
MRMDLPERRRFIRSNIPLKLEISLRNARYEVVTKNISPIGFMVELPKELEQTEDIDIVCRIPSEEVPVKIKGKVVWQTKTSLEDNAPYHIGVEIVEVEDKSKNVLLKFLCDLLYNTPNTIRSW